MWEQTHLIWLSLQDASSIQCYLWDMTLLFVQREDFEELSRHTSFLQVRQFKRGLIDIIYVLEPQTDCLNDYSTSEFIKGMLSYYSCTATCLRAARGYM